MTNSTVKKASQKGAQFSTQAYLRLAEIHDNTLVLKNGGLRAVLEVASVNMNLKSEEEQNALISGYQSFLNSLEFPVQIVVRSKKLDINQYLENMAANGARQQHPLVKQMTGEYIEYVRRLVEFADIMEKHFYIVVPFDPYRAKSGNMFEKFWGYLHLTDSKAEYLHRQREFAEKSKDLNQRVDTVTIGLENCGLPARRLSTNEIIKIFYESYNPGTSRNQSLPDLSQLDLEGATN